MPETPLDDNSSLVSPDDLSPRSIAEAESDTSSPTVDVVRHGGTF